MVVSIEQHVDWVERRASPTCARSASTRSSRRRRPRTGWVQHVNDCADITLYPARELLVHGRQRAGQAARLPALHRRRRPLPEDLRRGRAPRLSRLRLRRSGRAPLQRRRGRAGCSPTSRWCSSCIAELGLPPMETMSVGRRARALRRPRSAVDGRPGRTWARSSTACSPVRPDRCAYRLYRPASPGPHPIVAYFHGGGWVLGGLDSDDPFCRDLCVAVGRDRGVGRLPPRARGALPRGGRRRVRRRSLDRRRTPTSWAARRAGSRCAGGARAATSPPSSASSRAMPAGHRSPGRCW